MTKLICFDLDGVLVDACEIHRVALNDALSELNFSSISIDDHFKKYNGLPTKTKLKLIGYSEDDIQLINDLKQKKTLNVIQNSIHRDEIKIELMEYLIDSNFKIACVTNSIKETTYLMLKKAGIFSYFDCIVTNQDITNPKPDPEPYYFAMKVLNANPFETIIIEDSENGLKAAYSSGAKVIKVSGPEEVSLKNLKSII